MATLYELTENYKTLLEMMDDPEIDDQAVTDTMESLDDEIETKADGYAWIITELTGRVNAIDSLMEKLAARKKRLLANIDRMKGNLKEAMIITGKTKFDTKFWHFGIQKNGGKLPILTDYEPEDLPSRFVKKIITFKMDQDAVREYLDAGKRSKYFRYGERGESLRIRQ